MLESNLLTFLSVGFLLGLRHALDADHLAAVSTVLAERPSMRAHSTGQNSTSGRSAMTIPPEWIPRCRGKSTTSDASSSARGGIAGGRASDPEPPATRSALTDFSVR